MDDLIHREEALKYAWYLNFQRDDGKVILEGDYVPAADIEQLPAVDAVEVVHSAWGKDTNTAECLNCKSVFPAFLRCCSYCPFCGAKMDGQRREDGDA